MGNKQKLTIRNKLAPWMQFAVPFLFSLLGMTIWFHLGKWYGVLAFILCFLIGSFIGNRIFSRWATLQQIKDDLRYRIDTE